MENADTVMAGSYNLIHKVGKCDKKTFKKIFGKTCEGGYQKTKNFMLDFKYV